MTTEHNELYDYDITYDTDEIRSSVVESATSDEHLITVTEQTPTASLHTVTLLSGQTVDIW